MNPGPAIHIHIRFIFFDVQSDGHYDEKSALWSGSACGFKEQTIDVRVVQLFSVCAFRQYRKTLLISTYVFSGLATEQVLIFGAVLTFGGYDKAE